MRRRALMEIIVLATVVVALVWVLTTTYNIKLDALKDFSLNFGQSPVKDENDETMCSLPKPCPPETFSFHLWTGAANVVGPKICFNGKIIMSHVLNNIGPGLNIVVAHGESGIVEKSDFLNLIDGNPNDILKYLKDIEPDRIVLVASFDNAIPKLTPEIKQVLEEMGSSMIKDLKHRDGWLFVGKTGAKADSFYEKISVNNPKTNLYDGWPTIVDVGGCYLKTQTIQAPQNTD